MAGTACRARRRTAKYQLLFPLLDLTTTLDPYFNIAYRFGAIFLSEAYPGGPGRPDQSVALLQKAITVMPQKWQYYHDIGFVYYWRMRDYKTAATWFQRAADQPNAPNWLQPLAASMLVRGNDRAAARFLWQQIAKSEEAWLRRNAERSLLQLQAMDQIDQLGAVIQRFPPAVGEQYSWDDLMRRRILIRQPVDPAGAPYVIDPADRSRAGVGTVAAFPDAGRAPAVSAVNLEAVAARDSRRCSGWPSEAFSMSAFIGCRAASRSTRLLRAARHATIAFGGSTTSRYSATFSSAADAENAAPGSRFAIRWSS